MLSGNRSLVSSLVCLLWLTSARSEEEIESNEWNTPGVNSVSGALTTWRHRTRRTSMASVWSSWSGWTSCSRTCGGGSSFRTRHCISRIPMRYMTKALLCPGDSRQYQSCNTKDCPDDQLDYRSIQCSVFNERDGRGQLIREWLPVYNAQGECELVCHTSDGRYMYTFGRVLDGTRCRFGDRDMCINGKCAKVGCDGELYSNRTKDLCGVCGGRNETCGFVRNIFTDEYPVKGYYTYSKIASIPAGATNIRIKDRSGLNYIALKDEENNFIFNGDWTISWPGSYQAAGTSFRYDRMNNGLENVIADGPINRSVNVMIIFRERNPGVEFEYFLPPKSKDNEVNNVNYNNEIQMLSYLSGTSTFPEKRRFGTIEPTNRKEVTSYIGTPQLSAEHDRTSTNTKETKRKKKKRKNKKSNKETCGKCKRIKGRAEHYCRRSFALLIEVVDQTTVDGETRYDVIIEQTFKNSVHLNRREYLWVPNTCPCPKLRTRSRYIVTGDRLTSPETGESRLTLQRENLVVKYKVGLQESWDRLHSKEQKICAKYQ